MLHRLITPASPTVLPVTVATAKSFLRVEHTHEDELLKTFIRAAASVLESAARISFLAQVYETTYKLPHFEGGRFGLCGSLNDPDDINGGLTLPVQPVASIQAFTIRGQGQSGTLGDAHYTLSGNALVWSPSFAEIAVPNDSITIRYVAGAANPDDLAARFPNLQMALLMTLSVIYDERGLGDVTIPSGAWQLLAAFK